MHRWILLAFLGIVAASTIWIQRGGAMADSHGRPADWPDTALEEPCYACI